MIALRKESSLMSTPMKFIPHPMMKRARATLRKKPVAMAARAIGIMISGNIGAR